MAEATNRQVVLASRPAHVPEPANFDVVAAAVPEPGPGEALVRNLCLSMEPAIRARLDGVETYMPPIEVGEPIQSPSVGRVVRSNNPRFTEGDVLFGFTNWEDYSVFSDEKAAVIKDRLGFDEAINYRRVDDLAAPVRDVCPDGVDLYCARGARRPPIDGA
jgi:NADPH-dependent curcumin reductase CurA